MKLIPNTLIPLPGYVAMTLWPFIFIRRDLLHRYTDRTDRHESIHARQQLETLILPFLLWYALEWLIRLIILRDPRRAYRSISFEQEAYMGEAFPDYLDDRPHYAWMYYLFSNAPK